MKMSMIRGLLSLFILFGLINQVVAQENTNLPFTKHRFQVMISNGAMLNHSTLVTGEHVPETAISLSHTLQFDYQYHFSKIFYLQAGVGTGTQAFSGYVKPPGEPTGTDIVLFTDFAEYFLFYQYTLEAAWRLNFAGENSLTFLAGAGAMRPEPMGVETGGYQDDMQMYLFKFRTADERLPFATLGTAYNIALRNRNQLSLRLHYQHHFKDWYKGVYLIYDETSTGTIRGSGSRISFGLGYTFTGLEKAARLQQLAAEKGGKKEARKALKETRRSIDPMAKFIGVSAGLVQSVTKFKDPNNIFFSPVRPEFLIKIQYQQGVGNNFFLEGDYLYHHYYAYIHPARDVFAFSLWSSLGASRSIHQFSLGGGCRLTNERQVPFLNIHAGIFSGIHSIGFPQGYVGSDSWYYGPNAARDSLKYVYYSKDYSRFSAGVYGAVSKDFRLANRLYLSAQGRYQLGLIKLSDLVIHYSDSGPGSTPPTSGTATGRFRGSGYFAMVGFKYRITKN
jgi:hypothetical protein